MPSKVLIGPSSFAELDPRPLESIRNAGFEIVENPYKRRLSKPELIQLLSEDVTGIIAGLEVLDKEVLQSSKLKVISRCGSGLDNIDLEAASELKIQVCSTPLAPARAVAELTVAMMILLLRRVRIMDQALHSKQWQKMIGLQMEGKNVAIVGFGRIGRRVAELLHPFDVRILAVDPFLDDPHLVELDEALSQADIVTLHCSATTAVLGMQEFQRLKHGAILLNSARAHLVDGSALLEALRSGRLAGAWFDVYEEEPYSGPLTEFPQVILTPHAATYTKECRASMELEAVENLIRAFQLVEGDQKE